MNSRMSSGAGFSSRLPKSIILPLSPKRIARHLFSSISRDE